MAKGRGGHRRVPSTPGVADESLAERGDAAADPAPVEQVPELTPSGFVALPDAVPPKPSELALLHGTGCLAGHSPYSQDAETKLLGAVPSARTTGLGLGILGWCLLGLLFLSPGWLLPALAGLLGWWGFSVAVQRREGHRGKCLRIRGWRRAWGGLVPHAKDPTRPAEGEE